MGWGFANRKSIVELFYCTLCLGHQGFSLFFFINRPYSYFLLRELSRLTQMYLLISNFEFSDSAKDSKQQSSSNESKQSSHSATDQRCFTNICFSSAVFFGLSFIFLFGFFVPGNGECITINECILFILNVLRSTNCFCNQSDCADQMIGTSSLSSEMSNSVDSVAIYAHLLYT